MREGEKFFGQCINLLGRATSLLSISQVGGLKSVKILVYFPFNHPVLIFFFAKMNIFCERFLNAIGKVIKNALT